MFYSITAINGEVITMEDPYGDILVSTRDFFDYDPQENDVVVFANKIFSIDKQETDLRKKENYNKLQELLKR